MKSLIASVVDFVKTDWKENPVRCVLEIAAWMLSIGCSLTMAITIPNPPFLVLYPLFITQCAIFAWSAWTRNSTGMLANYALLVSIDSLALAKMLLV